MLTASSSVARACAILALTAVIVAGPRGPSGALAEARPADPPSAQVFDEAARLVRFNFYDRNYKGRDWDAISARYRTRYLAAATPAERSSTINAMLGELDASHMIHVTPDEPAYYQLSDIFSYGLRRDIPKHFPKGIAYPGIGVFTRDVGGKTFVTGVLAGLPAAKAGIVVGDEILTVDGAPFQPVRAFDDKVGTDVSMTIRRVREGPVSVMTVRPERIEPGKAFRTAMRAGARIIEAKGKRLGYIHVWSYAGEDYQRIMVEELSTGKLKDADALIWDLRDGWGGAHPRYLDLFNVRGPDMTLIERDGDRSVASFKWRKPVALLVNGGTRSGKEVLTYGFKKYGHGPVIGARTAGALLAGRGFLLSDRSFLMVAVNDVTVDGERLEGTGVAPTVEVPFEIPYAAGRDPQLEKAIEILSQGEAPVD
ncbi:S41 family peptidase [Hyphomicrobium sp.]|uniref:S41 family peptidase n=1 Tax=Hyphomicrobium sp. TaxID=82 RepID=UPI0025C121BA|nr:S41 family peptidase [Hyphomicrobium sp.]MCC7251824.1 PDZ domain-containing protein [Hyphomicrobium sp.]